MPLASYIRSVLFPGDAPTYRARRKPPVADQKALADVLASVGASRLANNLNQLAKAANIGDLYFDEGTKRYLNRAAADIAAMLMRALGYAWMIWPRTFRPRMERRCFKAREKRSNASRSAGGSMVASEGLKDCRWSRTSTGSSVDKPINGFLGDQSSSTAQL